MEPIRLLAYHAGECDPKKCTSLRLKRFGLLTLVPRPSGLPRGAVILTPKAGGEMIRKRYRYFNTWKKVPNGDWKITLHVNNTDVREEVGALQSTWFLSEKVEAAPR